MGNTVWQGQKIKSAQMGTRLEEVVVDGTGEALCFVQVPVALAGLAFALSAHAFPVFLALLGEGLDHEGQGAVMVGVLHMEAFLVRPDVHMVRIAARELHEVVDGVDLNHAPGIAGGLEVRVAAGVAATEQAGLADEVAVIEVGTEVVPVHGLFVGDCFPVFAGVIFRARFVRLVTFFPVGLEVLVVGDVGGDVGDLGGNLEVNYPPPKGGWASCLAINTESCLYAIGLHFGSGLCSGEACSKHSALFDEPIIKTTRAE